ncbi:hypothetical protein ASC75_21145 [Aminobacter sp. DSM 101952]|uniref:fumarylacetoacetate hydrolase family protein n=1 Tax=Aminobacter sp. DSM 101952 TaxID=2735891 RepID=UPI0006F1DCA6|nr:fumarylacetoacetate hydrolase family protein [Aminobacter sp. DSM 101952]KQU74518.1 hypothetical protein ASC75_21145 [Aminobacter sp. DSM 101952]
MKLASLKSGRDGVLLVVSKDLKSAVRADGIAPTMQALLDEWDALSPRAEELYAKLNRGAARNAFALDQTELAAPLPRTFQYLDGACYLSHIRRNRMARGESLPDDLDAVPLIYQGISYGFGAWNDPITGQDEADLIDFEAEVAAILGDVPRHAKAPDASKYIRLFCLLQDTSLRRIVPFEVKRTFGLLVAKPESALGPIAVTPDELGDLWDGSLVGGRMAVTLRGRQIGNIDTGLGSPFSYGDVIAYCAQTRNLAAGTILGLGTVSNDDDSVGCACIGEYRALETLKTGKPTLDFMKKGDVVRLELLDRDGVSVMGAIEQRVD